MRVREMMKSPVITVSRDAPMREVVTLFSNTRISGIPVVDDAGLLVGIVTEHDIIRAMMPRYEDMVAAEPAILNIDAMHARVHEIRDNPVRAIMIPKVISLQEDDSVLDAASRMILKKVKMLPVVRDGKPVGIVSRIDIINAVMQGRL